MSRKNRFRLLIPRALLALKAVTAVFVVILSGCNTHKELPAVNVVEDVNVSLKEARIDENDVTPYLNFMRVNGLYANPRTIGEFELQYRLASDFLKANPYGKFTGDIKGKIIQELNIDFLLRGLNRRELRIKTIYARRYEEYTEKNCYSWIRRRALFPHYYWSQITKKTLSGNCRAAWPWRIRRDIQGSLLCKRNCA